MKEIGGYIEFEYCSGKMLYENLLHFDCGRSCLEYLITVNNIKKLYIPLFLCDSIKERCERCGVSVEYYEIDRYFHILDEKKINKDAWVYLVNYYGQLSSDYINCIYARYQNLIIDNVHAYFTPPMEKIDTLYSCRKFFGVSDGGILYTRKRDAKFEKEIKIDKSFERMNYLLGRFEGLASDYYKEYIKNNKKFSFREMKWMSLLTGNLLRSIDYQRVRHSRESNFKILHNFLSGINELNIKSTPGPYAYPFLHKNGSKIRKELINKKIYIPVLWPEVLDHCKKNSVEKYYAENILPLPCDQRYCTSDMEYIAKELMEMVG